MLIDIGIGKICSIFPYFLINLIAVESNQIDFYISMS